MDWARLALQMEAIFREKAKENQKLSEGHGKKKGLQNSVKADRINTQKELAELANVSHDTIAIWYYNKKEYGLIGIETAKRK